jgi:acetyltransferase
VRSDLKGRGLGDLLLRKLLRYCARTAHSASSANVLHENRPMRELAQQHGFHIDAASDADDALHIVLDLHAPVGDGAGMTALARAFAALDLPRSRAASPRPRA